MKRGARRLVGSAVVATVLVGAGWRLLTPKIGHATRAQIVAAFPPSLRVEDSPDPQGEARYARLVRLCRKKKPDLGGVERLLSEGSLRIPMGRADAFPEFSGFRVLAKFLQTQANAAASRKDHAGCLRVVRLNLKLAGSLIGAGGNLIDHLVAVAHEAIAARAAYEAEMKGGLDPAGKEAVLDLLPPLTSSTEELAGALRRELYGYPMAFMLDPEHGGGAYFGAKADPTDEPVAGTFDPLATARAEGRIVDSAIQNLSRPLGKQSDLPDRIAAAAGKGLPDAEEVDKAPEGFPRTIAKLIYRVRMNNGENTLGRTLIADLRPLRGRSWAGALPGVFDARLSSGTPPGSVENVLYRLSRSGFCVAAFGGPSIAQRQIANAKG